MLDTFNRQIQFKNNFLESDEGLKAIKHDLYDEMINREMDKDTRQGLYDYH
ncbi:hypothetical protein [Sphingobacterium sp. UBA3549]|uniref:hypothetical protein n=1 Tax=Sphingobacterium sp. UBA3549 TaxID=1947496 RepID=UPI0025EF99A2|nr:hypothetical protein [Sphingobacterium sp. UBA3549]